MDMGLLMQYVVIVLVVAASLVVVMRKQFPGATRRLRIAMALPLLREGSPAAARKLGRWIAPEPAAGGKDCGGCNGC